MSFTKILPAYHFIVEENRPPKIKMINQYLLISKLGTGYFSKVYLALKYEQNKNSPENKKYESYYAAKAIHAHQSVQSSSNLEREIRTLRCLNHPYIIKFYKVLYAPSTDIAYIIMEWANCGTLEQIISKKIKLDERTIASIFIQIALALSYLHLKGIVHRDIKPSNILLFSDGTAKLSDFGISHSLQSAESVFGTPLYQAPDIFDEVDSSVLRYHSNKNKDGSQFNSLKTHLEQKNLFLRKYNRTHPIYKSGITFHVQKSNFSTFSMPETPKELDKIDIDEENKDNSIITKNDKEIKENSINNEENNSNKNSKTIKNTVNFYYVDENNSKNCNKIIKEKSKNINNTETYTNNCDCTAVSGSNDGKSVEMNKLVYENEKEQCQNDPKKSDVWSLGISMYQTAYGILPYEGKNMYEIINNINNSELTIPENNERQYSSLFVDLIVKMLKKNSEERMSIDEVIQHPFFTNYQTELDKETEKNSNIISIGNGKGIRKVMFDIKPFQPPKFVTSQIVKIDAIVCPENYSFSQNMKHPFAPNNRFSFIDDNS